MALAPSLAAQATREALQYLGTSQLDSTAATSIASDDLQVSPHPESDAELAGVNRGPGTTAVPLITTPQAISPDQKGVGLAFNGLSHRDQRIAGTGIYANTQFSTEPPDQGLAVGNGFVLQTVNAALAIYDASSGSLRQGPTALNQFFRLKPEINRANGTYGDFTSDPRTYYDPQVQRWFVTVVAMATNPETGIFSAPTRLLIAVSNTSDPTQGWKIYGIDTTHDGSQGCPCFGDQPLIATDAHGLFITTNSFSLREGFAGVQIYALSKRLLSGGAMPTVVHWNSPKLPAGFAFSLQPAIQTSFTTDDALHGVEYLISVADIRNMLDHRLAVWALSNTASLSDPTPVLRLRSTIVQTQPFGVPPDAQQRLGNTELGNLVSEKQQFISTNDHRMQQAVFADGKLWSALTTIVAVEADAVPHAGIAYFALTPSVTPDGALKVQTFRQGYVAARNADLFYPALTMAPGGNGAIAFMVSGADYYPSIAFAHLTLDGAGDVHIVAPGAAPHDGFSGYKYFGGTGSGRTGDYSAAAVDERGEIWIASEYIPLAPRTLLANWGSFIAQIVPVK
ncbi:MAG TPA: hypothetical protein VG498_25640 [Terriglobales bacterium]|nr:hypothetical protein [Terriglobales bacterium]